MKNDFADPLTEVYVSFYTSALTAFSKYNLFLQRSDPLAHKVCPMTEELIRKVGMRFLKPHLLSQSIDEDVIDNPDNYLPIESIHIGLASKSTLNKLLNCRYEE